MRPPRWRRKFQANQPPRNRARFKALRAALSLAHLPKRLRAAAKFLLAEPDFVAFNSVATIAERSVLNGSAWVRLAQAIGLTGFAEIRQILRRDLLARSSRREVERGPGVATVRLGHLTRRIASSLSSLASTTDDAAFERGASMLAGASTVFLLGTRPALPALSFVNAALSRAGIRNLIVPSVACEGTEVLGFAQRRDAAVCLDLSTKGDEVQASIRTLVERGVPILTITDDVLGRVAGASMFTFDVGDAQQEACLPNLIAALALAKSLVDSAVGLRSLDRGSSSTMLEAGSVG